MPHKYILSPSFHFQKGILIFISWKEIIAQYRTFLEKTVDNFTQIICAHASRTGIDTLAEYAQTLYISAS